jgi:hypothetical protein
MVFLEMIEVKGRWTQWEDYYWNRLFDQFLEIVTQFDIKVGGGLRDRLPSFFV